MNNATGYCLPCKPRVISKITKTGASQFTSALAHEVRNPLSNINLAVEMLKRISKDADEKLYLDIIMRASWRINQLVSEFLTTSQSDETGWEEHSIHQLVDNVLAMTEDRIRLKNIKVIKELAEQDCTAVMNIPKMKIALINIIINAIDAMDSVKGELRLSTKLSDGKYALIIEDNGCGIKKEHLKKIFRPYFTSKPGGMGLGLSTTHAILRSSHIKVNVEPVQTGGTRFILLFDQKYQSFSLNKQEIDHHCVIEKLDHFPLTELRRKTSAGTTG
ncbi:MAG TPA: HAMP domain-containing sensor histidine kinase [Chitinophagaceae bacterium]|nr:HAMP domain-containing sensor histidine kinase [Chitinophagaceae bacterium]